MPVPLGLYKQIRNLVWFMWTSWNETEQRRVLLPRALPLFFPPLFRHVQLRIRMKCPRGVTISSHVSAASHTCIHRLLLHILPVYFCNSESAECDARILSHFTTRKYASLQQVSIVSADAQKPIFVFSHPELG
jgi:hypothetical protein